MQHSARRDESVIIATADRRLQEEVSGFLEPGQGTQLLGAALDIGVTGLEVIGLAAMLVQLGIDGEQAGGFHVDHKSGTRMQRRQIARQHQADLVGKDLLALIVDDTAAVAIAVKAQTDISAMLQHGVTDGMKHFHVFRIGIVAREGMVELAIHLDHLDTHGAQDLGRIGPRRAIAAGRDDLEGTLDGDAFGDIVHITLGHAVLADIAAAGAGDALTIEDNFLQPAHLVRTEGERAMCAHFHTGPAIGVVAGGDHGHARDIQIELGEIGHGRERKADVMDFDPGGHQTDFQRLFDAQRIAAKIVADNDLRLNAEFMDQCAQPHAQRLHTVKVEIRSHIGSGMAEPPARIIFPKTGRLDQRFVLERPAVRLQ